MHKTTGVDETWTPINDGLPSPEIRGRMGLDVSRSNPNVLYAFVDIYEVARKAKPGERDSYGRQRGDVIRGDTVYRSADKGRIWVRASDLNDFMELSGLGSGTGQGLCRAFLYRQRVEHLPG